MNQTVTPIDSCQEISLKQKQQIEDLPIYCHMALGGRGYKPLGKLFIHLAERECVRNKTTEEVLYSPDFKLTMRYMYQKLVLITPGDIGFDTGAYWEDIEEYATKLGLIQVPMDTAPCMMLQMRRSSWSNHPSIIVASEPVFLKNTPFMFSVNKLELGTFVPYPYTKIHKDQPFLFRRP